MTIFGVDVASFQGTIDWPKVKASGIRFAIARCVREGDLGVDAYYARNVAGARAAGLDTGAYCYLSGGGRAATQAALFIRTIGDPAGMFIVCDVESGALTPTAADVRTFAAAWYAVHPDHPLVIYGGNVLRGLGTLADLGPLWMADYGANVSETAKTVYALRGGAKASQWHATFGGWTYPAIWQFGSKGRVPGISGSVDVDAIETADLAALTGSTAPTPAGATPMFIRQSLGHCVTTTDARVYPEPGGVAINSPIKKGSRLRVFGGAEGWRWVQLSLGGVESYGWVRADEVAPDPEPLTVGDGPPPVVSAADRNALVPDVKHTVTLQIDGVISFTKAV